MSADRILKLKAGLNGTPVSVGDEGFTLPPNGQDGQALLSDGNGGTKWGNAQSDSGFSDEAKQALMAILGKVAYLGEDAESMQDDLDNLEDLLGMPNYMLNGEHFSPAKNAKVTVNNNVIHIDSVTARWQPIFIPLKRPITVNDGDTVTFKSENQNQKEALRSASLPIRLVAVNNANVSQPQPTANFTPFYSETSSAAKVYTTGCVAKYVQIQADTADDYVGEEFKLSVEVNGEVVF